MDVQPGKPADRGPREWFTGEVWIAPITAGHGPCQLSPGNVRFAPGARTAWHSHSIAQTLYVIEGEGVVQARGEAVITIRPGDVVNVAGGEWHWHGAAPGQYMPRPDYAIYPLSPVPAAGRHRNVPGLWPAAPERAGRQATAPERFGAHPAASQHAGPGNRTATSGPPGPGSR